MKKLDLAIAAACQNDCVFCSDKGRKSKKYTFKEVMTLLKKGRQGGCEGLELSALEPLLRKDVVEIVHKAREMGYKDIHMVTNGQALAKPAIFKKLKLLGLNKLTISMHSNSPDTENIITKNNKSYQDKVIALSRLKKAKYFEDTEVACNIVINRYNYRELDITVKFISMFGIKRFNIYFPKITGNALKNFKDIIPDYEDLDKYINRIFDLKESCGLIISLVDIPYCVLGQARDKIQKRIVKQVNKHKSTVRSNVTQEKIKRKECAECVYDEVCEGVFKNYIKFRTWREFQPVLKGQHER